MSYYDPFEPESGIWFIVCLLVVVARLYSRCLHLGSCKNLRYDDYLIIVVLVIFFTSTGLMQVTARVKTNVIGPGEDPSSFSPQEVAERIYGSKLRVIIEQAQIVTIWLVKACLLIMYTRMTQLLSQRYLVKAVCIYVLFGFLLQEILWFGVWCRPFNQYWAVPPNSVQCSIGCNHKITNLVLNLSSSIMILIIPLPLVYKLQIPLRNKIILSSVFLLGVFNIVAACLNKWNSFHHPTSLTWMLWYVREAATSILCANLPLCRQVLQKFFRISEWSNQNSDPTTLSQFNRRNPINIISQNVTTSFAGSTTTATTKRSSGFSFGRAKRDRCPGLPVRTILESASTEHMTSEISTQPCANGSRDELSAIEMGALPSPSETGTIGDLPSPQPLDPTRTEKLVVSPVMPSPSFMKEVQMEDSENLLEKDLEAQLGGRTSVLPRCHSQTDMRPGMAL